jgi:hypothetical protein
VPETWFGRAGLRQQRSQTECEERPSKMTMSISKAATLVTATTLGISTWCCAVAAGAADFPTPLQAEPIPKVESLPARYPATWSFLNYAGDRIELRNVGSDSREVRGQLQAHDSAMLLVPDKRPEIYVADTSARKSMWPIPFGRVAYAVSVPTSSPSTTPRR